MYFQSLLNFQSFPLNIAFLTYFIIFFPFIKISVLFVLDFTNSSNIINIKYMTRLQTQISREGKLLRGRAIGY